MSKVEALSASKISQVKNGVNTSDKSFAGGKSFPEKVGRAFRRAAHIAKKGALVSVGALLMFLGVRHALVNGEMDGTTASTSRSEAVANVLGTGGAVVGLVLTAAGVAIAQDSDSFEEKEEKRAEKRAKKGAENGPKDKTIEYRKAMEMAKTL